MLCMSPHTYYQRCLSYCRILGYGNRILSLAVPQMTRATANSAPLRHSEGDDELHQGFDVAQIRHLDWRMGVTSRPREWHIDHAVDCKRRTVVPPGRHAILE